MLTNMARPRTLIRAGQLVDASTSLGPAAILLDGCEIVAAGPIAEVGDVSDVEVFGDRLHVTLPGIEPGEATRAAQLLKEHLAGRGVEVESARSGLPSL